MFLSLVCVLISFCSQSPESDWQKVDYLMEFGEWLFVNEYPVADALDQVICYFRRQICPK